jgi:HAD superfamily hydrolase (TIGR01509 family)
MKIELLVFDFDGVLVDSEVIANRVLAGVLTEMGYPITPEESVLRFMGMNGRRIRAVIESETGRPLPEDFEATMSGRARALFETDLVPIAGADALLQTLSGARCIASNSGHAWIRRALRTTGLAPYFDDGALFSAADVVAGKPAPDLFLHAATKMGAEVAGCVVIEDSPLGVAGGVAAGMTVLGFTGASHIGDGHGDRLRDAGAVTVFDKLSQLPEMLMLL